MTEKLEQQAEGLNEAPSESSESPTPEESNLFFYGTELGPLQREIGLLCATGPFVDNEGRVAVRAFKLSSETLLGYLIEELPDSFLIVFPAVLSKNEDSELVSAVHPLSSPTCRLFKSKVTLMGMPTPTQVLYYLSLTDTRFDELPDYFTIHRKTNVAALIAMIKDQLNIVRVESNADNTGKVLKAPSQKTKPSYEMSNLLPDSMASKLKH